jgi:hypothetical protein
LRALFILLLSLALSNTFYSKVLLDDREIRDDAFKFTFLLPTEWKKIDSKVTKDSNGISYSFKKDTVCSIMLLAIRSEQITNMEDFIYTTEKDISLNIPKRVGDYVISDNEGYDSKSATYKDTFDIEHIFYFRTKLPDAPYNYVYMLRFITRNWNMNDDLDYQIKKISDSFLPTAK